MAGLAIILLVLSVILSQVFLVPSTIHTTQESEQLISGGCVCETAEELNGLYENGKKSSLSKYRLDDDDYDWDEITDYKNWIQEGAVTDIKNQLGTHACWAFAEVAAVEGIHKISRGNLITFSTQQLIDCTKGRYAKAQGCKVGGNPIIAFNYISKFGITQEGTYPFIGIDQPCKFNLEANPAFYIDYYDVLKPNNEAVMKIMVANQPIVVMMELVDDFYNLSSEIYEDKNGLCGKSDKPVWHFLKIVGYGKDGPIEYWLVKNSWGTMWGVDGYGKIRRNILNMEGGVCSITKRPSWPVISIFWIRSRLSISICFIGQNQENQFL